jgi:formylglycine-generating enzyme required for sulfatase activity
MRRKIHSINLTVMAFTFVLCLIFVFHVEAKEDAKGKAPQPQKVSVPKPGDVYKDPVTGMELVFVSNGCYSMGDATGDGAADEKPVHKVCENPMYVGKYEVTVGQFKKFVAETGYQTDAEKNTVVKGCWAYDQNDKGKPWDWRPGTTWKNPNKYQENQDEHPVACVSWYDLFSFNEWLNKKSGKTFRIMTESEWEYAARAGTKGRNYWGDEKDNACTYANVADNTPLPGERGWKEKHDCVDGHAFAAPVGRFKPNAFGLYDMMGNVSEWTWDWYDNHEKVAYVVEDAPQDNPMGPSMGTERVFRGGSWFDDPRYVRSADRDFNIPEFRSSYLGFRMVMKP